MQLRTVRCLTSTIVAADVGSGKVGGNGRVCLALKAVKTPCGAIRSKRPGWINAYSTAANSLNSTIIAAITENEVLCAPMRPADTNIDVCQATITP